MALRELWGLINQEFCKRKCYYRVPLQPAPEILTFNEGEIIEWFGADSLPPCKRIDTEPSNSLLCEENDLKDKTEKLSSKK